MPAYNCEKTLEETLADIPKDSVDEIILVDDFSRDHTVELAKRLGLKNIYCHTSNEGYGANQKTCYDKSLERGADLIIMLHPDYQYDPLLIPEIIQKITEGADVVFASRMKNGREALKLGMPCYKYFANRCLTAFQNKLFGLQLSEYHTGYRAYRREVLQDIDYKSLSNDFIFDNQITLEFIQKRLKIAEIYCPAKYIPDSSSINLKRSVKYGFGVIYYSLKYKYFKKKRCEIEKMKYMNTYLLMFAGVVANALAQISMKKSADYSPFSKKWSITIAIALVIYGISFLLYSYILRKAALAQAGSVMAIATMLLVVLLSGVFYREVLSGKQLSGVFMGGVAIYLILS